MTILLMSLQVARITRIKGVLDLFSDNLLPIFLIAGAGYFVGKWLEIKPQSLSRVVFYIFSPCLIFDILTQSNLENGDMIRMMGFAAINMAIIGMVAWLITRMMGLERKLVVAVVLTSMLVNAGNYGLSVNKFAFGDTGLAHASLFFVTSAVMIYTVGVMIASLGRSNFTQALVGTLKIPTIYAVLLALVFVSLDFHLPLAIRRTTSLLGNAAIPTMLVLLGLQLQRTKGTVHVRELIIACVLRLVGGAALAVGLSAVFGLQGAARQAGIMEAAMPTAVMATVLATEYDVEPSFVTTVVFISTLFSPLTITPLLAYLGA